jgi:hypothetical protein
VLSGVWTIFVRAEARTIKQPMCQDVPNGSYFLNDCGPRTDLKSWDSKEPWGSIPTPGSDAGSPAACEEKS